MSSFAVTIKRIRAIEEHPNADAIELAVIDGYRSVVKKGEFVAGDLVAYIPEASLLPRWLLEHMGFWDPAKDCGMLNGKDGNRVKAIKLRGALSQGICYPVQQAIGAAETGPAERSDEPTEDAKDEVLDVSVPFHYIHTEVMPGLATAFIVREGDDVANALGITKYEPPIPVSMSGEVFNAGAELTLSFDVENWKSYPDVLQNGEEVVFTEKLHGTCTVVAILPYKYAHPEAFGEKKNILIFSKGLGAKGLVFKNNERNAAN